MVTELKWPDTKVKGAIELCTKRRLTKKCLYSQEMKYLVLVTDKVESGSSRSRSLEQEMSEAGIWDTEFSLGDLINLDDESEGKKRWKQRRPKPRFQSFRLWMAQSLSRSSWMNVVQYSRHVVPVMIIGESTRLGWMALEKGLSVVVFCCSVRFSSGLNRSCMNCRYKF